MTRPPALLIVHQGAMGDLVCIFPIIAALRRSFRPIGLMCQGSLGRLAAAEGLVEASFPIEAAWTASLFTGQAHPEARRRLAPFTHILCFSASEPLARSLQAISGATVCRVPPRPPPAERVHVTDHAQSHLRACGWPTEAAPCGQEEGPVSFPRAGGGNPALALLHAGAGSPRKRWPLEGFLATAERLKHRCWQPQFVVGPAEEDILPLLKHRGEAILQPRDAVELIARLRGASAYIGNDSGVSHLAAWAGVPSVVIFGPSDPERWRPRGHRVEVVRAAPACAPCFERGGAECTSADCLDHIRIEGVLLAFDRVVSAAPGRAGR
ncbi:MAG: glycosyltransferase family 9 protein [Desulfobacterales bacterium]|jgi:ADP-heptose:LPS heptosyltransferase|nr:glycosyltransferase family 9 protein [Desulfobacterales bacterium]